MTRYNVLHNLTKSEYLEFLPKFKEERTQKFTTIIFTLIALILFGLFAINPTLSTIANLQKQLEDDTNVQTQLDQKIANLGILQTKYQALSGDLPTINAALPKTPQTSDFIGQLVALARRNNIAISSAQTAPIILYSQTTQTKPTTEPSFSFSLSGKGTYSDIQSFLVDLATYQRIITLDSVAITQDQDQQKDSGLLQIEVSGKSYFMGQ